MELDPGKYISKAMHERILARRIRETEERKDTEIAELQQTCDLALAARDEVRELIRDENPTAYAALQKRWEELQDECRERLVSAAERVRAETLDQAKECAIAWGRMQAGGCSANFEARYGTVYLDAALDSLKSAPPQPVYDYRKERDLLLIAVRHATMLIENEANWRDQAYAIVNNLRNSLAAHAEWLKSAPPQEPSDDV